MSYDSKKDKWHCFILVAPYWNLNQDFIFDEEENITILVAPYWNLNFVNHNFLTLECIILVAPYWNLNMKNLKQK